jgi:ATP-dependent RNA helicase RhlE
MSFSYRGRARSFSGHRPQPQRSFVRRGARIDRSRYVNAAVEVVKEPTFEPTHTFAEFGLNPQILANIQHVGYTAPTPIQDQAIPALMDGRDVVGVANTGTGKTAAFLLPLIHKVVADQNQGVLIVAPTRELAVQIHDEFKAFAYQLPVSAALCIGGANINSQSSRLRNNPHFVIGTPGRLKDLINRGALNPNMFTNIVLDEVDRMLDIGFRRDIKFLIAQLPAERHGAFFSATMNYETEEIMRELLTDPVKISVKTRETSHHIHQDIVTIRPGENKIDVLHKLLLQEEFSKVMVFGRTKHGINKLEQQLYERGVRVSAIHGNKTQNARQRSLDVFKQGRVQALLATDIAARGIDVSDVTHVINFDEPESYEDYIHRIGRTGRAGKTGVALTFVI